MWNPLGWLREHRAAKRRERELADSVRRRPPAPPPQPYVRDQRYAKPSTQVEQRRPRDEDDFPLTINPVLFRVDSAPADASRADPAPFTGGGGDFGGGGASGSWDSGSSSSDNGSASSFDGGSS